MKPSISPLLRAFMVRLVNYVVHVVIYQATCRIVDRLQPLSSSPNSYFSPDPSTSGWEIGLAFFIGLLVTVLFSGLFHFIVYRRGATTKIPCGCFSKKTCSGRGRSRSSSPPPSAGRYIARPARSGSHREGPLCPRCQSVSRSRRDGAINSAAAASTSTSMFNPLVS